MEDFEYHFLDDIISVGNVDVLTALWQLSFHQKEKGKETRRYLKQSLPVLCEEKGLLLSTSFRKFVEAYDEKVYRSLCSRSPNYCLAFFAKEGDWRNVRIALKKEATNFNWALYWAARGGQLDLVKFFVEEKGASGIEEACYKAGKGNHLEVIEYLLERTPELERRPGIEHACYKAATGGQFHIVKYLIEEKGATAFDEGLVGAAEGGHRKLVKYFMKEKGADEFEGALQRAAFGGQLEIVKYFIDENGAHDFEQALYQAALGNRLEIVKFFVEENGTRNLEEALEGADHIGARDVVLYLVQERGVVPSERIRRKYGL